MKRTFFSALALAVTFSAASSTAALGATAHKAEVIESKISLQKTASETAHEATGTFGSNQNSAGLDLVESKGQSSEEVVQTKGRRRGGFRRRGFGRRGFGRRGFGRRGFGRRGFH